MSYRWGFFRSKDCQGESPKSVVVGAFRVPESDLAGLRQLVSLHVELVKGFAVVGHVEGVLCHALFEELGRLLLPVQAASYTNSGSPWFSSRALALLSSMYSTSLIERGYIRMVGTIRIGRGALKKVYALTPAGLIAAVLDWNL